MKQENFMSMDRRIAQIFTLWVGKIRRLLGLNKTPVSMLNNPSIYDHTKPYPLVLLVCLRRALPDNLLVIKIIFGLGVHCRVLHFIFFAISHQLFMNSLIIH